MSKKKKRALVSNVTVGEPGLDMQALRSVAQNDPMAFVTKIQEIIAEDHMTWNDVRDIKKMFKCLYGVSVPATVELVDGVTQAINADAFALLAGNITIAGFQEGLDSYPSVSQDLVTEMDDNKKISVVASIISHDNNKDGVPEGQDYPLIGASDESYVIHHKRNGRRFEITAETIEEANTSKVIDQANALNEISGEETEEQSLRRICDVDGSGSSPAAPYALEREGGVASLFTTTANNPTTRTPLGTRIENNGLTDATNLDASREQLAGNKNSRGNPVIIPANEMIILGPEALRSTYSRIRGSRMTPGIEGELNPWGPEGEFQPRGIFTPWLDTFSTSAWYMGWFRKQYRRKWKLRFEYVTLSNDTESFLRKRIAFQARIGWDMEVGATSPGEYVVQNLQATTPPS